MDRATETEGKGIRMRRIAFALLATGALVAIAWAQANNSNTWQTPGNQTVGGVVQMCPRSSDGLAVPCANTTAGAAGFPAGATPLTAGVNGTTTAFSVGLTGTATQTAYLCGFILSGSATAAATGAAAITGTLTGFPFQFGYPATPATATYTQTFTPCLPASAVNTTISVNSPAPGAGGVASIALWGYRL